MARSMNYVKNMLLDFSDFSGGVNTTKPSTALRKNQCRDAQNVIIEEVGCTPAPGLIGLSSSAIFSAYVLGLHFFERLSGTEHLIAFSSGKYYAVNVSTGALTELYDTTGTADAYFANAHDKCFVSDSTKVVKIESGTVAYQVGIAAPAGATAAKLAGGSLPDGAYQIYISYAREISGAIVLYSKGMSLGTVTTSGSDNSIRISTFANSTDAQVSNKVVWMTDAAGSTFYYYHETGDNTTTTVDITSNSSRNAALLYSVLAQYNDVPGAFEYLTFQDGRIWGSIANILYYSIKAGSVYDLEKYPSANYYTMPFNIEGLFRLGTHLYMNTQNGIIALPNSEPTSKYEILDNRWHFKFMNTVDYWNGGVIGLTNDGVRFFDGQKFSSFDYSIDIKSEIDKLYVGANSNFKPCGKVHRRSGRTEYHLSFRNTDLSSNINNKRWVLNLDDTTIMGMNTNEYKTPWERWSGGFNQVAISKGWVIYTAQSKSDGGTICKERDPDKSDRYIYNEVGNFLSNETEKEKYVISREVIPDLLGICTWFNARVLAQLSENATLSIYIGDASSRDGSGTIQSARDAESRYGVARYGIGRYVAENPQVKKIKFKSGLKGRSVYIKVSQTADDSRFNIQNIMIVGKLERSNLT